MYTRVGRSINQLQNPVILFIFKLYEIPQYTFCILYFVILIVEYKYEFYYDDVNVMSFINTRYGNVAVEIIPQKEQRSVIIKK